MWEMNNPISIVQEKAKTNFKYLLVKDNKQQSNNLYYKGNKRTWLKYLLRSMSVLLAVSPMYSVVHLITTAAMIW